MDVECALGETTTTATPNDIAKCLQNDWTMRWMQRWMHARASSLSSLFFCWFWFCLLHKCDPCIRAHKSSVKIGIKMKNRIHRVAINQTVAAHQWHNNSEICFAERKSMLFATFSRRSSTLNVEFFFSFLCTNRLVNVLCSVDHRRFFVCRTLAADEVRCGVYLPSSGISCSIFSILSAKKMANSFAFEAIAKHTSYCIECQ